MREKKIYLPKNSITGEDRQKMGSYLKHATLNELVRVLIMQEQERLGRQMTQEEVRALFQNRSVCPHCERLQLRKPDDKAKMFVCPHCGTISKKYPLAKYIAEGHWK